MSFGENLISLRKQMGWSQDDLANNLNLSRQAISKWENDTSKPDIDNVKKISKIFSVTIDDLLNNEVPKEKAVALDVKKQEKKERTITIVKLMIIAVIVLYVISVIYKFASLLIIVNGVQKYANLSNYHYVITTYDENGLAEKEECWFKDGVSKTVDTIYNGESENEYYICIDYNNMNGYTKDDVQNNEEELDVNEYLVAHKNFNNGGQLIDNLPSEIKNINFIYLCTNGFDFIYSENRIAFTTKGKNISLDKNSLLPILYVYEDKNNGQLMFKQYEININVVENLKI